MEETLSLLDTWVKGAVEHQIIKISYYSGPIKNEVTEREVEPDFILTNEEWKEYGCWGFCRLRNQIRVFNVKGILKWNLTENKFKPNPEGRWTELGEYYNSKNLSKRKANQVIGDQI